MQIILSEVFVLVLLCLGHGLGQTMIPDTVAGNILRPWLDAFNSGDRTKIETYVRTFDPKKSVDLSMAVRNESGGFALLGIESSEPKLIKLRVKEKASSTVAIGLKDDERLTHHKNVSFREAGKTEKAW